MNGYDEITVFCFAWATFPGAAAAFREKMHFGIDIFVNLLPKKVQRVMKVVVQFVIFVIMAFLFYLSLQLMMTAGEKRFYLTQIPYKWFDLSAVVGFGLMTIYSAIFFVQDIRGFFAGKEADA